MPRIDRFLALLDRAGGSALHLAAGEAPRMELPTGLRPMAVSPLTEPALRLLLSDLRPSGGAPTVAADGSAQFEYVADGLGRYHVRIEPAALGLAARFVRNGHPASGAASREGVGLAEDLAPPEARPAPAPVTPAWALAGWLAEAARQGASDLHVRSGLPPMLRIDGQMAPVDGVAPVPGADLRAQLMALMPADLRAAFDEARDADFAHEIAGVGTFRCNVFVERRGIGAVFRVLPSRIPTLEELKLPPVIRQFCALGKGLVLVTGPTGSGKSTTLAAMVDQINRTRAEHIVTIEDPIEFVHQEIRCRVTQREVGAHAASFRRALRAALREDPDVVLIGELRDLETTAIALETAETGHLVFGTLHTTSAVGTIDRLVDQFPGEQQKRIRAGLAESLRGVVAQTLCPRIGGGRVAALEILVNTPAVANLIREGKTHQVPSAIQTGGQHGMVLMNARLADLVRSGAVRAEDALQRAHDPAGLAGLLRREEAAGEPSRARAAAPSPLRPAA
jgi:twitching motility protein PilT